MIVFINMERVLTLVLFHIQLERVGGVIIVLFWRTTRLVNIWRLGAMVAKLRWWRTPRSWKMGWRRKPVIKMTRRWCCERWRRTSIPREIKWGWWTGESRWWYAVLSIKSGRRGKTWRWTLLYNVLRGHGRVKHLRRWSSLSQ